MEARPCQITEFFNGTKQMLVPLFQRAYEWRIEQWETLWSDILERYEQFENSANVSHFTGAIVTAPARSVPVGVSKFLVIDGQQRLTTIALLLCALRSLFDPDSKQARRITRLLLNEDDDGLDYYKLLPTQPDRPGFQALLESPDTAPPSHFKTTFEFFRKKLQGKDSDDKPIDLSRFFDTVQNRVNVVMIQLGDVDDPYLIFESLNGKGTALTQADLVRNYLLLRIHTQDQQAVYNQEWLPLQDRLGDSLPEFIRQYLIMERGEDVTRGDVYSVLKRQIANLADSAIPAQVARLNQFSTLYKQIIDPSTIPDSAREVREHLARIQRWELATSHPLLLKLVESYGAGRLTSASLCHCIKMIESFAVRRVICGVPTNQLKRIFISLTKDFDAAHPLDGVLRGLTGGQLGRRWPKDDEFERHWVIYRAYSNPVDRCRFILESLERAHPHKEPASFENVQIEHVLPQTPSEDWRSDLGPTMDHQRETWAHTIGNLTLTAYNPKLSNGGFAHKKVIYAESNLLLNRYFEPLAKWDETAIQTRARALLALAKRLWPRPETTHTP
ncbi:MAG: DUF262 domain-containing protein [Nannocystis sp.]|nr:DUF262 domain-containing protein [Nannocystis sp.]